MERSNRNLQKLLEAIKSAEVVESRVQLIYELKELKLQEPSDLVLLAENLTTFWEDFTCLDVSQCMLNKSILHVAAALLESGESGYLVQLLALGIKASKWCEKHLKMSLMSTEDSHEEEHCNFFFQLLLDFMRFSAAGFSAMRKYFTLKPKGSMLILEKFIVEQLTLAKSVISEFKRVGSLGSEALKTAQLNIDSAVNVCKEYSEAVDWNIFEIGHDKDVSNIDCEAAEIANCVTSIIKGTAEKMCELGVLAAQGGGSLVAILNVSWKGLITLLQLGKGAVSMKINVADIILTLISLVNETLKCAAEAWSSSLKEEISIAEAKKTFVPVKFYLINAVKLACLYPCQVFLVYREIADTFLIMYTIRLSLSNEKLLTTASEMLAELLDQASQNILYPLLNSAELKQELKSEILQFLFPDESSNQEDLIRGCTTTALDDIHSFGSIGIPGPRRLVLARVAIYIHFLKNSIEFEDDIKLIIAKKLGWLFNMLVEEDVYSFILTSQFHLVYGSGKPVKIVQQPVYPYLQDAIKTFMVVVSSSAAWTELQSFLLENLFHPHFLCWEILIELWCFLVRHADTDLVNLITKRLCSLLLLLASPESVLFPGSALRKLARSVCMIVTYSTQSVVDHILETLVGEEKSLSSVVSIALFMEGFPLDLLSDNRRTSVRQKMISEYIEFIEKFGDKSLEEMKSGLPLLAVSASLHSFQVRKSDVKLKILDFLVSIIHGYGTSVEKQIKKTYVNLLMETLTVISNMEHLYTSDKMKGLVLELQDLFISKQPSSDTQLHLCKPNLASFMAGFAHMEVSDFNKCKKSLAVLELYHMLLREKHWALVHLAATAFGYFAARTNCNELWKFVPQNAALSYDIESGRETSDESFMLEMKAFLDKDRALTAVIFTSEQFEILRKEGLVLKERIGKISNVSIEANEYDDMEIDGVTSSNKRQKLPDGIGKGMELLHSGMKIVEDGLSRWHQCNLDSELHDKFLTHFARLEDEIGRFSGLVGDDQ